MDLIENGVIDLSPEYQREVVWTKDRQSGLIDSLMENYYIPPVIFNVKSSSREILVCVDGKQRLSSIKAFIEGSIPCRDAENRRWYFCRPKSDQDGKKSNKGNVLPRRIKEEFTQKVLVCCEITDLSPTQEEDLFSRVQLGLPLAGAEKMRAKRGPWNDLARLFEQDFEEVLALTNTERARGFQILLGCFAQILESENHTGKEPPKFKANCRTLEKFAHDSSTLTQLTQARRSHLAKVFTIFKELASKDVQTFRDNGYKRAKNFTAIEVVAVAVLISRYGEVLGPEELLKQIRAMRHTAREKRVDLFGNSPTWGIFWDFIENVGVERQDILERQASHDAEASDRDSLDASEEENETALLERFRPRRSVEKQSKPSHTATSSRKRKRSSDLEKGPPAKVASLSAVAVPDSVSNSSPYFAPDLTRDLLVPADETTEEADADDIDADDQSTSSGYSSHEETRRRSFRNNPPPPKTHPFPAEETDQVLSSSPVPIPSIRDATADAVHHPAHNRPSVLTTEQPHDGIQVRTPELPARVNLMANHVPGPKR